MKTEIEPVLKRFVAFCIEDVRRSAPSTDGPITIRPSVALLCWFRVAKLVEDNGKLICRPTSVLSSLGELRRTRNAPRQDVSV